MSEDLIYKAMLAHAKARGVDLKAWPNQQALMPDEYRWMRAALIEIGVIKDNSGARNEEVSNNR